MIVDKMPGKKLILSKTEKIMDGAVTKGPTHTIPVDVIIHRTLILSGSIVTHWDVPLQAATFTVDQPYRNLPGNIFMQIIVQALFGH